MRVVQLQTENGPQYFATNGNRRLKSLKDYCAELIKRGEKDKARSVFFPALLEKYDPMIHKTKVNTQTNGRFVEVWDNKSGQRKRMEMESSNF